MTSCGTMNVSYPEPLSSSLLYPLVGGIVLNAGKGIRQFMLGEELTDGCQNKHNCLNSGC